MGDGIVVSAPENLHTHVRDARLAVLWQAAVSGASWRSDRQHHVRRSARMRGHGQIAKMQPPRHGKPVQRRSAGSVRRGTCKSRKLCSARQSRTDGVVTNQCENVLGDSSEVTKEPHLTKEIGATHLHQRFMNGATYSMNAVVAIQMATVGCRCSAQKMESEPPLEVRVDEDVQNLKNVGEA